MSKARVRKVLLGLLCLVVPLWTAVAAPKGQGAVSSASSQARNAERQLKKLESLLKKLTPAQVNQIRVRMLSASDSDSDGVPDVIEAPGSRCDSDSDDDGTEDGDELSGGDDPEGEEEVKGVIAAISETSITVGSTVFAIDSETAFLGDHKTVLARTDFIVGECVEAEGLPKSSVLTATKVKEEDDCGGEDDHGGGHD